MGLIDGKKILLIDDDPYMLDKAKEILEQNDFQVFMAINGFQGIKIANEEQPALIFLDIEMPLMDGYKVLASLKANASTKEIPVVLLTSQDIKIDKGKGFDLGAAMYINKPFSNIKLLSVVNAVINKEISFDWGK
ncbi:PleD family two-component system response regulator [candidate division CSSED10-310 bacterium]|uniref:PleD family two-component system response regulator n=1 Tax=candidate division CSSED10-310 bacterium TaxID=2855610 RepID=A0ABV6YRG6_UNCC1